MSERKVSLRVSAVGGDKLKAELRAIGKEGEHALSLLETGGPGASRGLTATGQAADMLMDRLTALSMKAAQAANSMKVVETSGSSVLARVNATTGVSGRMARDAADIAAYGRALDETRAKYNPMFAAIMKYRQGLAEVRQAHKVGAISADEMTAAISRLRQASLHDIGVLKGRIQGYQHMAKGAGMARFQMVQLGYQLNDIGVSLASGQSPFVVMVQQGAQIAQIYGGQGGVRAMFSQLGTVVRSLVTKFWPLTAVIGVGAAAIAGLTREINKTSDVTVTFGDTAKAVFQVIGRAIWDFVKPAAEKISEWFWWAWDGVVAGVKWTGNALINGIKIAVDAVATVVGTIPDIFAAGWAGARAAVAEALFWMGVAVEDFVGGVAKAFNAVFKTNLEENPHFDWVDRLDIGIQRAQADSWAASDRISGAWDDFGNRASATWSSDPMGQFFDAVSGQAQDNARKRLAGEDKGGGGGGKSAKDKAEEELSFIEKIQKALSDYATEAMDLGKQIGDALVNAFKGAEDALVEFVKTGKLNMKDLATSIIADLARIAIRSFITGPLAKALGGALGGPVGDALTNAFVQHGGGPAGSGPMRVVSAANFVTAPRLHNGMGGLRADEFAAVLQRGERVLNRRETRDYEAGRFSGGTTVVNFNGVRDMQSFRQSRTQVAADLSRVIGMARRAS